MWSRLIGGADKGELTKELANKILTIFFTQADFKDVLNLSSISACPAYIFATADSLQSLFKKIQVDPK